MAKPKIAHIVNPVIVADTSDLYRAQPVTFASMHRAQKCAGEEFTVELWAAFYREDEALVPDYFLKTKRLNRSVLDEGTFNVPKKLPFLRDILHGLYHASEADYFIYSNVDIAVQEEFYLQVVEMLEKHEAFVINRRTISDHYTSPDELPEMYREKGKKHPGFDCFIFPRNIVPGMNLEKIIIGANYIGRSLAMNLLFHADSFKIYRNQRLTFHLGEDRIWKSARLSDFELFNKREHEKIVVSLKKQFGPLKVSVLNYLYFDNPIAKPFKPKFLQVKRK